VTYRSLLIFALLFTAVGLVPAVVSCSDDDASVDDPTIAFRVVEGAGREQEVTREQELPLSEAESQAEKLVGFEIALPAALPASLAPRGLDVWLNPAAPVLLLQRGVTVTYSQPTDPATVVAEIGIGHPIEGPLRADGEETVDVPGIGPVLVGENQQRMANGAYMWLMGDVRYRLVYLEGADAALRDEVLRAIEELKPSP